MSWVHSISRFALILLAAVGGSAATAAMYDRPPPGSRVIGEIQHIKAKESDTFVALARRYDVGYREMRLANPDVDPWLPGEGTSVRIPTAYVLPDVAPRGIVINIPEMRIYYFPPDDSEYADQVVTYPIGIGREGWSTPLAETKIIQKIPNPTWTPPVSIKKEHAKKGDPLPDVVAAGPNNPLGQYALRLGLPSYLIHGTNKPAGIGMRVSHGCIRLFPEDIAALFSMVSTNTPVTIVSQPYKIGWRGNDLVMEAHPPDADGDAPVKSYTPWVETLISATQDDPGAPVDWERAESIVQSADGLPETIGTQPSRTLSTNEDDSSHTADARKS